MFIAHIHTPHLHRHDTIRDIVMSRSTHTQFKSYYLFYTLSGCSGGLIWDCLSIQLLVTCGHQSGALHGLGSPPGTAARPGGDLWESSTGADAARAGGRSKREKMKGRGKEGSAEGPLLSPPISVSVLLHYNNNFFLSIYFCEKRKQC